jgi:GntR family transcriptional regulator, rspAB operon transcriptional repressor
MTPMNDALLQEVLDAPPVLRPLDDFSGSLANRVYLSLKQAILSLAFRPGEIIRKPEICEILGVSRSPVSEAVARLATEALVDIIPQAGTFVARFSMDEIREGAYLRQAVELAAVERVAETITQEQLVQLRRNLRVQSASIDDHDFAGFYKLDAEMHEMILSFTGFRRLASLADTSWVHVNRARQLILPAPGRVEATLLEHQAIFAALHLGQLVTVLEPLVERRPDLFAPG